MQRVRSRGTSIVDKTANDQLVRALGPAPRFDVQCKWITGRIAIGGLIGTVENMELLCAAGVTHVLNLQAEFDDRTIRGKTGIDVTWVPIPNELDISIEIINAALR